MQHRLLLLRERHPLQHELRGVGVAEDMPAIVLEHPLLVLAEERCLEHQIRQPVHHAQPQLHMLLSNEVYINTIYLLVLNQESQKED